jgi:hypothetical protein
MVYAKTAQRNIYGYLGTLFFRRGQTVFLKSAHLFVDILVNVLSMGFLMY